MYRLHVPFALASVAVTFGCSPPASAALPMAPPIPSAPLTTPPVTTTAGPNPPNPIHDPSDLPAHIPGTCVRQKGQHCWCTVVRLADAWGQTPSRCMFARETQQRTSKHFLLHLAQWVAIVNCGHVCACVCAMMHTMSVPAALL
mmetsp:Transcript_5715/g.8812  ORF Transcript_5715/g.8812 Transcript_5715/m.8812 type:complete len:144 (+) Transcript_5715:174-605(+)